MRSPVKNKTGQACRVPDSGVRITTVTDEGAECAENSLVFKGKNTFTSSLTDSSFLFESLSRWEPNHTFLSLSKHIYNCEQTMRLLFAKALFRMARDARRDLYLVMMEYVPYEQRQEIGLPDTRTQCRPLCRSECWLHIVSVLGASSGLWTSLT